jgi:23S rRNA (cytidine1920-2'-O)/16S rRNA (cytidine1409-2'-O)-methyltransferase
MAPSHFDAQPSLAVMDVSFISATLIIPAVKSVLSAGGDFICLIKPQFEVGKSGLSKGGIVKDEKTRKMAVEKVVSYAKTLGFTCVGVTESSITGGDGNVEYLGYFKKSL